MTAALRLQGLVSGYQGRPIVHGVDLAIAPGRALVVLGPNGSGKSTLLKSVVGLVPLLQGRVFLGEADVSAEGAPARARRGLATVLQEANVFRNLSVCENLRVAWEYLAPTGAPSASNEAWGLRLAHVLSVFPEIRAHLDRAAGLLSGGQRQMVAMASALMRSPRVMLLDEPSAGLSPRNAGLLYEGIARVRATGVTLLLIEQNVSLGLSVADEGVILVGGRVRLRAPAAELAADPDLHRHFLGVAA